MLVLKDFGRAAADVLSRTLRQDGAMVRQGLIVR